MSRTTLWAVVCVLAAVSLVLAGCPSAAPAVVKETVVVEKEVVKEVEKVVTPTPVPQPKVFRYGGSWEAPPAFNGNAFAPGSIGAAYWFIFDPLFYVNPATGEVINRLAESFDEQPEAMTIKLRSGVVWHDGQPFTSKDVWSTLVLRGLQGAQIWQFIDTVETPDDLTVVIKWKKPAVFAKQLLTAIPIVAPYHLFKEWADQALAAMGDTDATNKVLESLTSFRPEGAVGTGPFTLGTVTASEMILPKNPNYFDADKIPFDSVIVSRATSNQVFWTFLMADQVDAGHPGTPQDVTEEILRRQPDMHHLMVTDLSEFGFAFNMRKAPFDDHRVRAAITHAVDRVQLSQATGFHARPVLKYSHHVLNSQESMWISPDVLAKMTSYEYNPERAEQLLTEAGFTRGRDGKWLLPDGQPFRITVGGPAEWSDPMLGCDNMATQLTAFGIESECKGTANAQYWPDLTAGNFDIGWEWAGIHWGYGHPYAAFQRAFLTDGARITGMDQIKEATGPDGKTYNIQDLVNELGATADLERQKEIVSTLAYIANEILPQMIFCEKQLQIFHNSKHITGWPPDDDPVWLYYPGFGERTFIILMLKGQIAPK